MCVCVSLWLSLRRSQDDTSVCVSVCVCVSLWLSLRRSQDDTSVCVSVCVCVSLWLSLRRSQDDSVCVSVCVCVFLSGCYKCEHCIDYIDVCRWCVCVCFSLAVSQEITRWYECVCECVCVCVLLAVSQEITRWYECVCECVCVCSLWLSLRRSQDDTNLAAILQHLASSPRMKRSFWVGLQVLNGGIFYYFGVVVVSDVFIFVHSVRKCSSVSSLPACTGSRVCPHERARSVCAGPSLRPDCVHWVCTSSVFSWVSHHSRAQVACHGVLSI